MLNAKHYIHHVSDRLHDKMFECVSQSPMSFFHINPSGRILNRFSKDMGSVDELLPQAMIDCFQVNQLSAKIKSSHGLTQSKMYIMIYE